MYCVNDMKEWNKFAKKWHDLQSRRLNLQRTGDSRQEIELRIQMKNQLLGTLASYCTIQDFFITYKKSEHFCSELLIYLCFHPSSCLCKFLTTLLEQESLLSQVYAIFNLRFLYVIHIHKSCKLYLRTKVRLVGRKTSKI